MTAIIRGKHLFIYYFHQRIGSKSEYVCRGHGSTQNGYRRRFKPEGYRDLIPIDLNL